MPGPTPVELRVAGSAPAWVALGFLVEPGTGLVRLGEVRLALGAAGEGLTGWTLRGEDGPTEVDGIPTAWKAAPEDVLAPHPNGALAVDHVVVATPDVDRTVAALRATGMALRRERDAGTEERPLRQAFLRHGRCVVEVAGPRDARGEGPARLWGLTIEVPDVDALAAELGPAVLGVPREAVQPGRRIATARRGAGVGTPLAFLSAP